MASDVDVLRVLKILGEVYPKYRLSSEAIEIYVRLLGDVRSAVLEQAMLVHISRSTFFPSIAELRQAAFEILEACDPLPSSFEAWGEVQVEIRRVGHTGKPRFGHTLVGQVVDMLGWRELCMSENPIADRAHFIQAYQALADRFRSDTRQLQVVGQFIAELKSESTKLLLDAGKTA